MKLKHRFGRYYSIYCSIVVMLMAGCSSGGSGGASGVTQQSASTLPTGRYSFESSIFHEELTFSNHTPSITDSNGNDGSRTASTATTIRAADQVTYNTSGGSANSTNTGVGLNQGLDLEELVSGGLIVAAQPIFNINGLNADVGGRNDGRHGAFFDHSASSSIASTMTINYRPRRFTFVTGSNRAALYGENLSGQDLTINNNGAPNTTTKGSDLLFAHPASGTSTTFNNNLIGIYASAETGSGAISITNDAKIGFASPKSILTGSGGAPITNTIINANSQGTGHTGILINGGSGSISITNSGVIDVVGQTFSVEKTGQTLQFNPYSKTVIGGGKVDDVFDDPKFVDAPADILSFELARRTNITQASDSDGIYILGNPSGTIQIGNRGSGTILASRYAFYNDTTATGSTLDFTHTGAQITGNFKSGAGTDILAIGSASSSTGGSLTAGNSWSLFEAHTIDMGGGTNDTVRVFGRLTLLRNGTTAPSLTGVETLDLRNANPRAPVSNGTTLVGRQGAFTVQLGGTAAAPTAADMTGTTLQLGDTATTGDGRFLRIAFVVDMPSGYRFAATAATTATRILVIDNLTDITHAAVHNDVTTALRDIPTYVTIGGAQLAGTYRLVSNCTSATFTQNDACNDTELRLSWSNLASLTVSSDGTEIERVVVGPGGHVPQLTGFVSGAGAGFSGNGSFRAQKGFGLFDYQFGERAPSDNNRALWQKALFGGKQLFNGNTQGQDGASFAGHVQLGALSFYNVRDRDEANVMAHAYGLFASFTLGKEGGNDFTGSGVFRLADSVKARVGYHKCHALTASLCMTTHASWETQQVEGAQGSFVRDIEAQRYDFALGLTHEANYVGGLGVKASVYGSYHSALTGDLTLQNSAVYHLQGKAEGRIASDISISW